MTASVFGVGRIASVRFVITTSKDCSRRFDATTENIRRLWKSRCGQYSCTGLPPKTRGDRGTNTPVANIELIEILSADHVVLYDESERERICCPFGCENMKDQPPPRRASPKVWFLHIADFQAIATYLCNVI